MMSLAGPAANGSLGVRSRGIAPWAPIVVVLIVGVTVAFAVLRAAANADDARVRSAMELRAEWRTRDFESKLDVLANPVETMAVLFSSESAVDAALFDRFAERSHGDGDPLRRLLWAPRATAGGVAEFPVVLEHSFTEEAPLAAMNLASEELRRATIEQARDAGRPLGTPALPLFGSSASGYALFWPVYRNGAGESPEARRAALRGFVVGTFAIDGALNAAIEETPPIVESIYFFVGRPASATADAVYSPTVGAVRPGGTMPATAEAGAIRLTRSFTAFGQRWTLVSDFAPAAFRSLRSSSVWALPTGVLLLTALLLAYLFRERRRRDEMEERVLARTAELRAANEALAAEIDARQKAYLQLVQAQKMEAVGNLTGGMAHDFNNLLGVIIGNLDLLRDRPTGDPEAEELAGEALDAALRGADLTRRLLAFARRQPLQPRRVNLNELVSGISNLLKRTLGEQIEITLQPGADVWPVSVDPAQLESSLANLATNARDAMPAGGQLIIVTANRRLDADYALQHAEVTPGDYAMIEVTDTGSGIPPDVASRIFEPFYTTKEQGKGTGLGLSMVFGFMKQSGGHINVYSEVGIGTTFRLYLPRAVGDADTDTAALAEPLTRGHGETVLAVEDNPSLRRVVVRQLGELGYRVLDAEDAQSALRMLESERVDLLFTDIVMPGGTSGYDLARAAQARWPDLKVVITSGFPEIKLNGDGAAAKLRLLSKPYRRDDLARAIREVLEA